MLAEIQSIYDVRQIVFQIVFFGVEFCFVACRMECKCTHDERLSAIVFSDEGPANFCAFAGLLREARGLGGTCSKTRCQRCTVGGGSLW